MNHALPPSVDPVARHDFRFGLTCDSEISVVRRTRSIVGLRVGLHGSSALAVEAHYRIPLSKLTGTRRRIPSWSPDNWRLMKAIIARGGEPWTRNHNAGLLAGAPT